jgi:hypothetical protein
MIVVAGSIRMYGDEEKKIISCPSCKKSLRISTANKRIMAICPRCQFKFEARNGEALSPWGAGNVFLVTLLILIALGLIYDKINYLRLPQVVVKNYPKYKITEQKSDIQKQDIAKKNNIAKLLTFENLDKLDKKNTIKYKSKKSSNKQNYDVGRKSSNEAKSKQNKKIKNSYKEEARDKERRKKMREDARVLML